MSFALIKRAIFGAPPDATSAGERSRLLVTNGSRSSSADTAVGSDPESLCPKGSSSKSKNRVDPRIISDATIGLSDGLTVPFALTAGLSALGDTRVVIYGGFAELIAGALSMGLGGYLGAKSEM